MVRPRPVEQTFLSVLYCQTGMSDPPEETVGAGLKPAPTQTNYLSSLQQSVIPLLKKFFFNDTL